MIFLSFSFCCDVLKLNSIGTWKLLSLARYKAYLKSELAFFCNSIENKRQFVCRKLARASYFLYSLFFLLNYRKCHAWRETKKYKNALKIELKEEKMLWNADGSMENNFTETFWPKTTNLLDCRCLGQKRNVKGLKKIL